MFLITVNDLLLLYKLEETQQHFYTKHSITFDIATPQDITKFKFLSLTIYHQSEYGTSIDQTNQIKTKILDHCWFDHDHLPKIINTPFPTDTNSCELDLSKTPPLTGNELVLYETRSRGHFNHTVGKIIHLKQWSRQGINFDVTHLAVFTCNPNKPAFLVLKHLTQ